MLFGAAATLASVYWLGFAPAAPAVAVNVPAVLLASSGGEVASPLASVSAVAWPVPPTKVAAAPLSAAAIEKLTVAPSIGLPAESSSRACSVDRYLVPMVASRSRVVAF